VSAPLPGQGEIVAGWLPGGEVASTVYVGPYDAMDPAYEALGAFFERQGRHATGVVYEYYLNDPSTSGEAPRTRIVFPLAP
jgi:effector-binding domain-containing protein